MANGDLRKALVSAALFTVFLPGFAQAACSEPPPPPPEPFRGTKGSIDRPFVIPDDKPGGGPSKPDAPGGRILLSLDACQPASAEFDKNNDVIAIVFTPPMGGARNALLLAHGNCNGVDESACAGQLGGGGKAKCVGSTFFLIGGGTTGKELAFDMPSIPSAALPELAGPAIIVVTKRDKLRCDIGDAATPNCAADAKPDPPLFCVDELFADATCGSTAANTTFPSFTVLPEINDFKGICLDNGQKPNCARNLNYSLKFAVDRNGNALVPMRWRGVLRASGSAGSQCADENCDTRTLQGFTSADPFPADPAKEVIDLPSDAVKAYDVRGALFEPTPAIVAKVSSDMVELEVEGVAHKGKSVLRFPSGINASNVFFDFRDRMKAGVGPIELKQKGATKGVCEPKEGEVTPGPRPTCTNDAECASGVCSAYRGLALGNTKRPTPTPGVPPPPPPPPAPTPPQEPEPGTSALLAALLIVAATVLFVVVAIRMRRSRRS